MLRKSIYLYYEIETTYNKAKISLKFLLFKLMRANDLNNRMIIILVCILLALLYLHADDYVQCINIYPDEIMDLHCSCLAPFLLNEQSFYSESIEPIKILSLFKRRISSDILNYFVEDPFFLTYLNLQDYRKRLFLLQHYNS